MRVLPNQFSLLALLLFMSCCAVAGTAFRIVSFRRAIAEIESVVNRPNGIDVVLRGNWRFVELGYPDIDVVLKVHVGVLGTDQLTDTLVELSGSECARVRWRAAYAMGKSCTSRTRPKNLRRIRECLKHLQEDRNSLVRAEALGASVLVQRKQESGL